LGRCRFTYNFNFHVEILFIMNVFPVWFSVSVWMKMAMWHGIWH
jgi:hypothetical protein